MSVELIRQVTEDDFTQEEVARWKAAGDVVAERMAPFAKEQDELRKKAIKAAAPGAKIILLRKMADNLGRAAAPALPCKAGCSGCCHMPTVITEVEAQHIAKATGAKLNKGKVKYSTTGDMTYTGVPCPFLVDNACSIYENRPFACRVYLVVHEDNSRCQIVPGRPMSAPQLGVEKYHQAYAMAFGYQAIMRMGELREFFPTGLGRKTKSA